MVPEQTEQLLLFVDLLGSKEAIRDPGLLRKLTHLLVNMKNLTGNYALEIEHDEPGLVTSTITPTVSTFSDHIVISFPPVGDPLFASEPYHLALKCSEAFIAKLVRDALDLGLLLRGGAAIGSVYHKEGVIVGEALVKAYELESTVARYPRIAVSQSVYSQYGDYFHIKADDDGIRHFDYPSFLFEHEEMSDKKVKQWYDRTIKNIKSQIKSLERQQRYNELSKWTWLLRKIQSQRIS